MSGPHGSDDDEIGVEVFLDLSLTEGFALAELCKRIGWADVATLSVDPDEARAMLRACDVVRSALAAAGVAVR